MKNNLIKTALSMVLGVSSIFATTANAADVEGNIVTKAQPSQIPFFMGMKDLDENGLPTAQRSMDILDELSSHDALIKHAPKAVTAKGPASGISYFEVGHVFSTDRGLESINDTQTITVQNHGGAQLFIYIWQYGYGNPNNGSMNGISKKPDLNQYRCGSDLHQCQAGETITGWLYGWDFSGQQSGYFQGSANSTAHPVGQYWSDSISIR